MNRFALVAAGSLIVVAACVRPGPSTPSAPVPTLTMSPSAAGSPPTSATATVSVGPELGELPVDWERLELPAEVAGSGYNVTVATDSTFVVGGTIVDTPTAWSSPDGTTWAAEEMTSLGHFPRFGVAWGDRVLLVGTGGLPLCGDAQATISWVRDAGGNWSEAPSQQALCTDSSGPVAVASDRALTAGTREDEQGFALVSPDGLHWQAAPDVPFPSGAGVDVLINTRIGFVAMGSSIEGPWVSQTTDGIRWSAPGRLPGAENSNPVGAAVVGDRLLGFLRTDGPESTETSVASSTNGTDWTGFEVTGLEAAALLTVHPVEGGLVALGFARENHRAWVSVDGLRWRPIEMPPDLTIGGYVTGIAIARGRAVLLGGAEFGVGGLGAAAWGAPLTPFGP